MFGSASQTSAVSPASPGQDALARRIWRMQVGLTGMHLSVATRIHAAVSAPDCALVCLNCLAYESGYTSDFPLTLPRSARAELFNVIHLTPTRSAHSREASYSPALLIDMKLGSRIHRRSVRIIGILQCA
jgi:hypothetical protein